MAIAQVNGINLYYEIRGQGEPLFLIQGFAGGHRGWFFQKRAFAKKYMVIAADSRGVGSAGNSEGDFTLRTLADDIVGLMDHLDIEKAHVLGMSMGGMVAQEFAINYPQRLLKLILASTYTNGEEAKNISAGMIRALGVGDNPSEKDVENIDVVSFVSGMTGLSYNRRLYKALLIPSTKIYARFRGFGRLMNIFRASSTCDTVDRLHLIKAPTLIICGSDDKVVPPIASDILASKVPNSKLVKLENGSHAIHMEMHRRFNREVLSFLKQSD